MALQGWPSFRFQIPKPSLCLYFPRVQESVESLHMRKKLILLASRILIKCLNLLSVLIMFINRSSTALQYNVTIDDQNGDPTNNNLIQYDSQEEWITGQNCTDCDLSPSLSSNAYFGTWMNATYRTIGLDAGHIKQASVTFEGMSRMTRETEHT